MGVGYCLRDFLAELVHMVEYVRSCVTRKEYTDLSLPQVSIVGRSNAGKSSMINALANVGGLAFTSKRPGKTRLINFFRFDEGFLFVDLPGYGFAKVSEIEYLSWKEMIEGYLEGNSFLKLVMIIFDIRRLPGPDDLDLIDWLILHCIPYGIILNKADKLNRSDVKLYSSRFIKALDDRPSDIHIASAMKKTGIEDLKTYITERALS